MIAATIAAVTLEEGLELGLRWGSGVGGNGENSVGFNGDLTGGIGEIFAGVFDDPLKKVSRQTHHSDLAQKKKSVPRYVHLDHPVQKKQ